MGLIRGGLLVIVSVILFIGFLLMNGFLVISDSLEYENIQKELTPVVASFISDKINLEEISAEKLILIKEYCANGEEFVFIEGGETFTIPCSVIENGTEAIIEEMIAGKVREVYYTEYNCSFIDCFEQQRDKPYFLVSAQTKDYFKNKSNSIMFFCLFISVLIFVLIENRTNAPILIGSLLLIASLFFIKIDFIVGFFSEKAILQFFSFLFTSSYSIAIKGIFIGIILIIIGIILKFFKFGFWVSNFFGKFKKKFPLEKDKKIKIIDKNTEIKSKSLKSKQN
jgi:hypothetical protein